MKKGCKCKMIEHLDGSKSWSHSMKIVAITGWTNSAVKLESSDWITVSCWSRQPFTGVRRKCTRLCTAAVQKTTAAVFENIRTSCATDGSRYADQLTLWKGNRNFADTGEEKVLLFASSMLSCICYSPKKQAKLVWFWKSERSETNQSINNPYI